MACRDRLLQLSTNQSLAGTGLAFSDTIPLANLPAGTFGSAVDLGEGNPLWFSLHIDETFLGGTILRADLIASVTGPGDGSDIVIATTEDIPIVHPIVGLPGPLRAGEAHNSGIARQDRFAKIPAQDGPPYLFAFAGGYKFLTARYLRTGTFIQGKVTTHITTEQPPIGMKIYPAGVPGNI